MTELGTLKTIRIFLASPGDLNDERASAKEIVDQLNESITRSGWYIDLLAWEDTLPGVARPQEIINREVDLCNLFVGILWKRWGFPTGEFSSGFEEEFERAQARNEASREPEIWLFFKQIKPDVLEDPGDQVRKTLAFRESVMASRKLLYKEFIDLDDWRTTFSNALLRYFLSKFAESTSEAAEAQRQAIASPIASATRVVASTEKRAERASEFPDQFEVLLDTLNKAVSEGDLDLTDDGIVLLQAPQIARLYLVSSSLVSSLTTDLLGVHAINLIYRFRRDFALSARELYLLTRSVVADTVGTYPGWYWFRLFDQSLIPEVLVEFASVDANPSVRRGSLDLLRLFGPLDLGDHRLEFFKNALSDSSGLVVKAGLMYLAEHGEQSELGLLNEYIIEGDSQYRSNALHAKLSIISKNSVEEAFTAILNSDEHISDEMLAVLGADAQQISVDNLIVGISHSERAVRHFCSRQLSRRGKLSSDLAILIKDDTYTPIRELAFEQLIALGHELDPQEIRQAFMDAPISASSFWPPVPRIESVDVGGLLFKLYSTYSEESLEEMLDWYDINGPIAYRALASNYFQTQSARIRVDLGERFEALKLSSTKRMQDRFGDNADKILELYGTSLHSYITENFAASALSAVNLHAGKEFLEVARSYFTAESRNVIREVVRFVGRHGDSTDLSELIEVAESEHGALQSEAAEASLTLEQDPRKLALRYLGSRSHTLVQIGARQIAQSEADYTPRGLEPLLKNEFELARVAAAYFIIGRLEPAALEKLLDEYVSSEEYYYDVTCWLDRHLYAPTPLSMKYLLGMRSGLGLT